VRNPIVGVRACEDLVRRRENALRPIERWRRPPSSATPCRGGRRNDSCSVGALHVGVARCLQETQPRFHCRDANQRNDRCTECRCRQRQVISRTMRAASSNKSSRIIGFS
jgi:hypothetical protein